MSRRPLSVVAGFAAWTLLVWATRIDNIWSDEALDTAGKVARTALAGSFVLFAVLTLLWAFHERRTGLRPCSIYLIGPFAVWTIAVWIVRGGGILLDGDHGVAFKVVHTALAVVSVGLAVAAVRLLQRHVEREGEAPAAAAGLEELVDG